MPDDAVALERLGENAIARYVWLQRHVASADLSPDGVFARRFCAFYRVRRNKETWRPPYFHHFGALRAARERGDAAPSFENVLNELAGRLPLTPKGARRIEASFASKLISTLDPERPTLDRLVLGYFGLAPPSYNVDDRIAAWTKVYENLECELRAELADDAWSERRERFDKCFPPRDGWPRVLDIKVLDFLIWAARGGLDEGV